MSTEGRPMKTTSPWVAAVGYFIFFSRWLQAPLYLGLIVAQLIYVIVFMMELVHLAETVWESFAHPGDEEFADDVSECSREPPAGSARRDRARR